MKERSPVNDDGLTVSRSVLEHAPLLRSSNHRRPASHCQLNVVVVVEIVDGSNEAAPVDKIAPETAASLKGSYRQTSPEGERIMCGVGGHQDALAARRAG